MVLKGHWVKSFEILMRIKIGYPSVVDDDVEMMKSFRFPIAIGYALYSALLNSLCGSHTIFRLVA